MKKLEEIRARAEKATEGPWEVEGPSMPGPDDSLAVTTDGGVVAYVQPTVDDAEFIAHSRTDVPKLVAALEAVEAIAKHVSQQAVDIYSNARGMQPDQRIAAASYAVEFEVIAADLTQAIQEALQ